MKTRPALTSDPFIDALHVLLYFVTLYNPLGRIERKKWPYHSDGWKQRIATPAPARTRS